MLCLPLLLCLFSYVISSQACYVDDGSLVTVGEPTNVCLIISALEWGGSMLNRTNKNFLSVRATLKADEFSTVNITKGWTGLKYENDDMMTRLYMTNTTAGYGVGISLGSAGIPSYQKAYRRADRRNYDADTSSWSYDTVTFPAMMAVIRVEEGNVKEITWDDTCNWCESTRCASNTYTYAGVLADTGSSACFVPDTECVVAGSEQVVNTKLEVDVVEECKLRVYITWTGTDSKGFHFLSAATRFSRLSSTQMEHIVIGGGA